MLLKLAVDWLNFTADRPLQIIARNYAYPVAGKLKPVKGVHGYTEAYENAMGTRIMWHNARVDMGCHIMYSGATMNRHLDNGISAQAIAAFHVDKGHRCTRIDLAIDCIDGELSIAALYAAIEAKTYVLPYQRKAVLLTGTDGTTLYIGSRTSDLFLRIYDKGREMGTDDNWKRVEIEIKGTRAMFFINLLVREGHIHAGQTAREVIKAMADFDNPDWQEIVGDTALTIAKGQNKDKNTKEWLITQCAPALGRYIAKSGDGSILEQFLAIVAAFCDNDEVRE